MTPAPDAQAREAAYQLDLTKRMREAEQAILTRAPEHDLEPDLTRISAVMELLGDRRYAMARLNAAIVQQVHEKDDRAHVIKPDAAEQEPLPLRLLGIGVAALDGELAQVFERRHRQLDFKMVDDAAAAPEQHKLVFEAQPAAVGAVGQAEHDRRHLSAVGQIRFLITARKESYHCSSIVMSRCVAVACYPAVRAIP